jgi:hypothetical protein
LNRYLNREAAVAKSQKKNLATFPAGLLVVSAKSMAQELEHLAQTYRHIAELKSHILRQRVMLKYVLDTGQPAELAESMLHALEESLRAFEKHRQRILERLPGER